MKLSTVHMFIGLCLIVALSFYFNRGEGFSVPRVVPFELEKLANTKEPFVSQPAPSTPSTPSASPVVPLSDAGYQAMTLKQRSDLLNQVQRLVRDEIRMARQLETLKEEKEEAEEEAEEEADADANPSERQGCDYHRRRREEQGEAQEDGESLKRHWRPDMSKYIRKDKIPCWGCSLDY